MPEAISLKLDTREFRRNLRRLTDREIPRWAARTINKCAFEVLDAEKAHAAAVFEFSGGQTKLFMSGRGAFRFDKATPQSPTATVYPNPGPGERRRHIFETQQEGGVFRTGAPGRFEVEGKVAVPVLKSRGRSPAGLRRTARGKVRRISRRKATAFRVGDVILERDVTAARGRRKGLRILFALKPQIKITPVFEFFRTARDTARRVLPEKAKREFERIRLANSR